MSLDIEGEPPIEDGEQIINLIVDGQTLPVARKYLLTCQTIKNCLQAQGPCRTDGHFSAIARLVRTCFIGRIFLTSSQIDGHPARLATRARSIQGSDHDQNHSVPQTSLRKRGGQCNHQTSRWVCVFFAPAPHSCAHF